MYGRNPLRKLDRGSGGALFVQGDPWVTIQGEGPLAGTPATFIRLWGCHLKCYFCDTDFESQQTTYSADALVDKCIELQQRLVVLTGGEPMRQNITYLIGKLIQAGHTVQIETAGNFWFQDRFPGETTLDWIPNGLQIVVSPKGPSVNPLLADFAIAWKYIISHRQMLDDDGLPFMNTQDITGTRHRLARPPVGFAANRVFVQPMDEGKGELYHNTALCVQLAQKHGYRLSIQTHKIIGVP